MDSSLRPRTEAGPKNHQKVRLWCSGPRARFPGVTGGTWRFGVLGPLVLELDGAAVPVPSGRQRSLLALLLHSAGAPLSRRSW